MERNAINSNLISLQAFVDFWFMLQLLNLILAYPQNISKDQAIKVATVDEAKENQEILVR